MDYSRVITGIVVTEKAERQKADVRHVYTLTVAPWATKVDVKNALKRLYDLDTDSVRILYVQPKSRTLSAHAMMEKRHMQKRALVTLSDQSKTLDLLSLSVRS